MCKGFFSQCTFIDFFLFFTSPFPSLLTFISISRRKEKWKMLKLFFFYFFYLGVLLPDFLYRQLPLDFFSSFLSDSTFFTSKPHRELLEMKILNFISTLVFLLHNSNRHYCNFWTYATRKKWQSNTSIRRMLGWLHCPNNGRPKKGEREEALNV